MATLYELLDATGGARADAPATAETQHAMAVGDVFLGNLAGVDDQDWVRIELQPGATYVIRMQGHGEDPVADPLLELYDAEGERVAFNDDLVEGGSLDSKIVFSTPPCTRDLPDGNEDNPVLVYYLNARSYFLNPALRSDGDYRLSVMEQQPLAAPDTLPDVPEALLDPVPTVSGANDTHTGTDADDILDGRHGADTLDGGGQPEDGIGDTASYHNARAGVRVSLAAGKGDTGEARGDTLIDVENLVGSKRDDTLTGDAGDNILIGGCGDDTLDGGPGADLLVGGPGDDTVSYRRAYSTHGVRVDLALGVADGSAAEGDTLIGIENIIGSVQDDELYGNDGDNRLEGCGGDDVLAGRGGADVFVFYHNGGHDTVLDFEPDRDTLELRLYDVWRGYDWQKLDIEADGEDAVIRIDKRNSLTLKGVAPDELGGRNFVFVREIRPVKPRVEQPAGDGGGDRGDGGDGGDACVVGATLTGDGGNNTLTGTECDDTLDGLGGDDKLLGLGGNDTLTGGPGKDTLDGGAGIRDYASYTGSSAAVTIDLGGTKDTDGYITASGGDAEGDKLKNIENLTGSAHGDTLTGDDNDNRLEGGPGKDTLDGGGGIRDYASYIESNAAVTIDLGGTPVNGYIIGAGGDAEGDKLKNIENLTGSAHGDTLTGDDNDNRLEGGPGADTIDGGDDVGGDYAYYTDSGAAVTIDLGGTKDTGGYITASGGDAEGDRIKNIERLAGSAHGDTLTGDGNRNYLWGEAGDDILAGGGGTDFIYAGLGNDTLRGENGHDGLWGGAGNDILKGGAGHDFMAGGPGADIMDGGDGRDDAYYNQSSAAVIVDLGGAQDGNGYVIGKGGDAEGDKLKNIENLAGSAHGDTLTGDDYVNYLRGREGDDVLSGGKGDDFLYGNDGDDELNGGSGSDYLRGHLGNDTLTGGSGGDTFFVSGGDGHDTIIDFSVSSDKINLSNFRLTGIDDPKLVVNKGSADTVITVNNDVTITLQSVTTDLDANDFIF